MAITDNLTRVTPYVQTVFDDDDLRDQLLRAGRAGRSALRPKPTPKPTRVKRVGAALREAGEVVGAFGEVAERRRSGNGAEPAPVQTPPTTQENPVNV